MDQDVCEQCGHTNPPGAQFCRSCDAYLGWDTGATTIGGRAVTAPVPHAVEEVATETSLPPLRAGDAPAGVQLEAGDVTTAVRGGQEAAGPRVVEVPRVQAESAAVTLVPGVPASVALRVHNASSVVDGFVVEPETAPGWLELSHPPLRLMPRDGGVLELAVGMREGVLVFAQRVTASLRVRSESDPTKTATVTLAIVVPPHGPPATLDVQPRLLRLTDQSRERFSVRIDNRQANFAQSFALSGSDPEGTVQFGFLPSVVKVPPGQVVEVRGHFLALAPPAGEELTRQLTVTAANDEGETSGTLTVVQHTSPEPESAPVTVRLAPRDLRVTNGVASDFEVHVDNRGGHRPVELDLAGRDPGGVLAVSVSPRRLVVPPGQVAVARGRVQLLEQVARGRTVTRPFTVVATDGTTDHEAPGSLEVTVTPSPLTAAELRVAPQRLTRADTRRGLFDVIVDNTRGAEPLTVWLSGVDSQGTAGITFTPPSLTVPPRGIGQVRMTVDSPRPPSGESATRELEVLATDGEGRLTASASFTQVSSDRRPLLRTLLVLCGALLVLLGLLLLPRELTGEVTERVLNLRDLDGDDAGREETVRVVVPYSGLVISARVVLALLAAAMVLGLTGAGRLVRFAAILVVVAAAGFVVLATADLAFAKSYEPGLGTVALVLGAVLAYAGGVLARRD